MLRKISHRFFTIKLPGSGPSVNLINFEKIVFVQQIKIDEKYQRSQEMRMNALKTYHEWQKKLLYQRIDKLETQLDLEKKQIKELKIQIKDLSVKNLQLQQKVLKNELIQKQYIEIIRKMNTNYDQSGEGHYAWTDEAHNTSQGKLDEAVLGMCWIVGALCLGILGISVDFHNDSLQRERKMRQEMMRQEKQKKK